MYQRLLQQPCLQVVPASTLALALTLAVLRRRCATTGLGFVSHLNVICLMGWCVGVCRHTPAERREVGEYEIGNRERRAKWALLSSWRIYLS